MIRNRPERSRYTRRIRGIVCAREAYTAKLACNSLNFLIGARRGVSAVSRGNPEKQIRSRSSKVGKRIFLQHIIPLHPGNAVRTPARSWRTNDRSLGRSISVANPYQSTTPRPHFSRVCDGCTPSKCCVMFQFGRCIIDSSRSDPARKLDSSPRVSSRALSFRYFTRRIDHFRINQLRENGS